jgi:hypothetical protein
MRAQQLAINGSQVDLPRGCLSVLTRNGIAILRTGDVGSGQSESA